MISVGKHKAKVIEADLGTTKEGAPQVAVLFELVDGAEVGQQITWHGYFGPKDETRKRTIESLRYCGWKGDDLSEFGTLDGEVELVIEHDTYNGNTRAKVAWVNKVGAIALKNKMSPEEKKAFAAQMMGTVMAIKAGGGGGGAPSPTNTNGVKPHAAPSNAASIKSDDIPF